MEREAVRQELRGVDMNYRNGYRMEWRVLVKRMMGNVTTTIHQLPDGTTRPNHHCHGPGQFDLFGYRDWTACYEAVANRLSRLGSRELGKIEAKAKRAHIQMFKASLWLATCTQNSNYKLLYPPHPSKVPPLHATGTVGNQIDTYDRKSLWQNIYPGPK